MILEKMAAGKEAQEKYNLANKKSVKEEKADLISTAAKL